MCHSLSCVVLRLGTRWGGIRQHPMGLCSSVPFRLRQKWINCWMNMISTEQMILEDQTSGKLRNAWDLERIVDQLASHVIESGKHNLPASEFNRAFKPYCNKSLSSLLRKMLGRLGCSLEGQVIQTPRYTDNTRKRNEALGVNKCAVLILMRSNAW